ncbi:chaperonin [Escherichia coli]|uniref:hypothetical protein n=1 Tax=Escherichia coli TaxID=562 RepID=UPI000A187889|nr:hypothetical protein [Escherichia coli]EKI3096530.1 chaperonin [Escherichia coli]MBB9841275.1 chaperonin [Escherichia coli]MBS9328455.1 chaperonin [Escherichia coli]OSK33746.1 hypothetical protein EAHG_04985 [Escherichia coli B671]
MSKAPKVKNWDLLSRAGSTAPLKENGSTPVSDIYQASVTEKVKPQTEVLRTQRKTVAAMPTEYVEAHERLRKSGKSGVNFSSYIYEAVREKLERDGAFGDNK